MSQIVDKTTMWLVKEKIIADTDLEVYRYGIRQGLDNILHIIVLLTEAEIIGVLWESITFLFSYTLLRRYAGGAHAKTPTRCFVYSQIINIIAFLSVKFIIKPNLILWLMAIAAAIIIFIFSPVETENNPLSHEERKIYGKRARAVLLILIYLAVVMNLMMQYKQVICILVVIVLVSVVMICELVKSTRQTVEGR